jgi:hypothetical protein
MNNGNLRVAHRELWFYPLERQWIRVCGGALQCCNNLEKGCLKIWKKMKSEKCTKAGKMCIKK